VITVRTAILILSFFSLFGCATQSHSSSDATFEGEYQPNKLHPQTLYDILVAEISGHANDYQLSLEKYLKQSALTKDPAIAKRAVRIAQHLRDTHALTKAVTLWIDSAPEEPEPRQLLANLLISQGQFEEAVPHFNKALDLGQHKVLLLLNSQLKNMNKSEITTYIELLTNAKVKEDIESDRLTTLGVLHSQLNEPEKALSNFQLALQLTPDHPNALYHKAETLKKQRRFVPALDTLLILIDKYPKDRQYNALHVQILFSMNKNSDAIEKIKQLISQSPHDRPLHNYLALTALDYNQLAESRAMFESFLADTPQNSAPYFYLAIIAERTENFQLAIEHYLKVEQGSNLLQAHTRAVSLHREAQDKEKVELITEQLIAKHPQETNTYILMLANWLQKFEQTEQAIKLLDKQIKIDSKNTDLLYARAMYLEPLDFKAAEQDFKTILSIAPDNPTVLNAFGYTLTVHTKRYDEALILIEKALKLIPNDPATIDSMGWVLFKLNRYDEAISYLTRAFSLFDDPEVGSHLIAALTSANQYDKANQVFIKISTSHPNNKFVKQARALLEK